MCPPQQVRSSLSPLSKPKKHAIIGGMGNLGQHLQQALLDRGHHVVIIDRLPPKDAEAILGHKRGMVEYISFTLGRDAPESLTKHLCGVETVYSIVTPDVQFGTRKDFELTNHLGVKGIVQACKESNDVRKLVYGSSLAVTNHFMPSIEQDESFPLPSLDSYTTSYDLTKRLGEDHVLVSNDEMSLKTCSLRLGSLICGPRDYLLRTHFKTGEKMGTVFGVPSAKLDTIAASDVAMAMVKASEKLDEEGSRLAGEAVFVTKSRNETVPTIGEMQQLIVQRMGWSFVMLPSLVLFAVQCLAWLSYQLMTKPSMTLMSNNEDLLPGMPPHRFMTLTQYEQTFDNSKARELLDWEPELSWEEAIGEVVEGYKRTHLDS